MANGSRHELDSNHGDTRHLALAVIGGIRVGMDAKEFAEWG